MAISLRRALLSSRNISFLLRTSPHFREVSHSVSSRNVYNSSAVTAFPNSPTIIVIRESRRGFSKGARKSKGGDYFDDEEEEDVTTSEMTDIGPSVRETAVSQMEAAVDILSQELSKLRTGRASAGMLDHIIVETGGVKMPLSRLAVVSVLDSKTLSVSPYDPNVLKELEKAIVSSPLGLNPKQDGDRLIAPVPPLTKEHMQALCKVVTKATEDVKTRIRRGRQKALDIIKKEEEKLKKQQSDKKQKRTFPKDISKKLEKEVDELTKKYTKSAEDMSKAKEKEITSG